MMTKTSMSGFSAGGGVIFPDLVVDIQAAKVAFENSPPSGLFVCSWRLSICANNVLPRVTFSLLLCKILAILLWSFVKLTLATMVWGGGQVVSKVA